MVIVRVLIADDHLLAREGVKAVLATGEDIQVVGEASNGDEAVAAVRELHPDVVLMDVRMPGVDGVEATRQIKESHPDVAVVMLTMYDDDIYVIEAVRAGANGYLLKDASRDLLLHTIRAARSGVTLVKSSLLKAAMTPKGTELHGLGVPEHPGSGQGASGGGQTTHGAVSSPGKNLSQRETEVLELLTKGRTNKEIGHALFITELTVKKHVASILVKLGAINRSDAAVRAVTGGLIHSTA